MIQEITKNIKNIYLKLGFKPKTDSEYWSAEYIIDENNSLSVDFGGEVFVHEGFNKYGKILVPKCMRSFLADSKDKINVLVKPLLTR